MQVAAKATVRAEAFLRDGHEDFRALLADANLTYTTYGGFVSDVVSKLGKYGSLSDAQVSAVRRTVAGRTAFVAKCAAESALLSPAPTGRTHFEGEVISTKLVESYYGISAKMLIMADARYKVWSSVPSALDGIKKGDRVNLTATLTPSDRDATFAFGKRPTVETTPAPVPVAAPVAPAKRKRAVKPKVMASLA